MSEEATLYGAVLLWRCDSQRFEAYDRNRAVIRTLPVAADYPERLLTREMFTAPLEETPGRLGIYRNQVIHFGASYNGLSEFWHLWLEQFENLLRRLHWCKAHLHLNVECFADDSYHWEALERWDQIAPDRGIRHWTFRGGPRKFV